MTIIPPKLIKEKEPKPRRSRKKWLYLFIDNHTPLFYPSIDRISKALAVYILLKQF